MRVLAEDKRQKAVSEPFCHADIKQAKQGAHVGQMRQKLVQDWDVIRHEERAGVHTPHRAEMMAIAETQQGLVARKISE